MKIYLLGNFFKKLIKVSGEFGRNGGKLWKRGFLIEHQCGRD